ncbi:MAG: hypothetical protein J6O72_08865, partial [Lachnospira sp.]|nr:hypothetical protein [Lachnospira sp.]
QSGQLPGTVKLGLFSNAVRKTNVTGVKKNFLKLTLDKSHFITGDNNIGTGYPLFYNDCCYAAEWR